MKHLILLLLLASSLLAVSGDILSVTILDSENVGNTTGGGWKADIVIDDFVDGGTYDFGIVDGDPTNAKIVFTVVSEGYNAAGELGTVPRTLFGTGVLRKPYPNQADNDETEAGGDLTITIALSEFIYADDNTGAGKSGTAPTVSIAADWYTDDGAGGSTNGNNAATDVTCTNNSDLDYARVIGNWAYPGESIVTAAFDVEATCFHRSGIVAVKFSADDQSAHPTTPDYQTGMFISPLPDEHPVQIFTSTIPVSGLDQGEIIDVDFVAYPVVGDADSILNTADGVFSLPTPLYTTQRYLNDKSETYGRVYAFVDSSEPDDLSGVASATRATADASPYKTIKGAAQGIVAVNLSSYSRDNYGGGIIELEEGNHDYNAGTFTNKTTDETWLIIKGTEGSTRTSVIINNSDNFNFGNHLKFSEITFTHADPIGVYNVDFAWFDNINTNLTYTSSSGLCYTSDVWYLTHSNIYGLGQLRPLSSNYCPLGIFRGNNLTHDNGYLLTYVGLGNNFDLTGTATNTIFMSHYTGMTVPDPDNLIIAYNRITTVQMSPIIIHSDASAAAFDVVHGAAIVQNICEQYYDTVSVNVLVDIAGDSTNGTRIDNIICWYNDFLGQRNNVGYNDDSGYVSRGLNWSVKNNITERFSTKGDVFTSDAALIGHWPLANSCGWESEYRRSYDVDETHVHGLYSNSDYVSYGVSVLDPSFVNDQSSDAGGGGNGDYHLTSSSTALIGRSQQVLIPYDFEGTARFIDSASNGGAVGAYEYGTQGGGGDDGDRRNVYRGRFIFR